MKYILNADTSLEWDGKQKLIVSKGIWNREETIIELSTDCRNDNELLEFLKRLNANEVLDIGRQLTGEAKEVFDYLRENDYLNEANVSKGITDILKEKKIMFITSEVFEEIKLHTAYKDLNTTSFDKIVNDLGISECVFYNSIDAYEMEKLCRRANVLLDKYDEIIFLLKNPNVMQLKIISKVLNRIELINSYSLIDNGMLFCFTCVPYETACFNCFDLRIRARLEGNLGEHRYKTKKSKKCNENHLLIDKNIFNLIMAFDLTVNYLIEDVPCRIGRNVGNVTIWDLNTMEVLKERLYKVPFCEGC